MSALNPFAAARLAVASSFSSSMFFKCGLLQVCPAFFLTLKDTDWLRTENAWSLARWIYKISDMKSAAALQDYNIKQENLWFLFFLSGTGTWQNKQVHTCVPDSIQRTYRICIHREETSGSLLIVHILAVSGCAYVPLSYFSCLHMKMCGVTVLCELWWLIVWRSLCISSVNKCACDFLCILVHSALFSLFATKKTKNKKPFLLCCHLS